MTHRAMHLARQHARLVNEIERTAPAVDDTYLGQALRRMKLPIAVKVHDDLRIDVRALDQSRFGGFEEVRMLTPSAEWASRFYFKLCAKFSQPAAGSTPEPQRSATEAAGSPVVSVASLSASILPADMHGPDAATAAPGPVLGVASSLVAP